MPKLGWTALISFWSLGAALSVTACDTHAVGVDECQSIEKARCSAARNCNAGITSDDIEAECERSARDNCLHGLPLAQAPASGEVNVCVAAIQAAGTCAVKDPKGLVTSCSRVTPSSSTPPTSTVCDIVETPEYAAQCSFLVAQKAADGG